MKDQQPALRFYFGLCLVLFSTSLFSQSSDENNNEWSITGSFNGFFPYECYIDKTVKFSEELSYRFQTENTQLLNVGIGMRKVNQKDWFQEFALVAINVQSERDLTIVEYKDQDIIEPVAGSSRNTMHLLLRWEYGKLFKFKKIKNLSSGISLSVDPFFNYTQIYFSTSRGNPFTYFRLGTEMALIPRVEYGISDKLSFVAKFPVGINKFYLEQTKIEYSLLPEDERSDSKLVNKFGINNLQFSVGFNYRI